MLSTGQVNSAFQTALGRNPTSSELSQYTNDSSFDGSAGQQSLISQLNPLSSYNGNSSGSDITSMETAVTKAMQDANDQYNQGVSQYDTSHPFNRDSAMADYATKAADLVSPYYAQQLNDYVKGMQYQIGNSKQDLQRTLTKLQADYGSTTGQLRNVLDTTLNQIGQQYGNTNGYDSGARMRAQGIQSADTQYQLDQAQRDYDFQKQNAQIQADRTLNQQIPLAYEQYQQGQQRNQQSDINTLQSQLYNYGSAENNYNRAQAGLANIKPSTVNGVSYAGGAFPGTTSFESSQQLATLLPQVQSSPYGSISALSGY